MKVILFDFFGVLSTPVYKKVIDTYISESERPQWMKKLDLLDSGDLSEDELVRQLAEHAEVAETEIRRAVDAAPVRNTELFSFIEEKLKGKYTIGLLTNIPRSLLERIAADKFSLFNPLLISSDLKLIKPSKEIFEEAVRRCGVQPREILFIDDGQKNIDVAKVAGFKGFVYSDFPTFLRDITPYL
ncbi:HAD-IA family hydrolase [Patescibacteria group bacterium]|nr:HAD-IA family hydrolase [Patescibacteria group bacterium]